MLEGRVAIITGGSQGIGLAIAREYAAHGARLLLVALDDERLQQSHAEMRASGADVEVCAGDVADPQLARDAVRVALAKHGHVDILVNCAGMITRTPMSCLTLDEWHRVINVNLHGTFYFSQAVLPSMCEQRYGRIINITSQMARRPHPSASPSYEVSKAGMTALTRHMAFHYAGHSIRVNAIAPGSIDTDLPKSMSAEARQRLRDAIPLQRLGEPSEVAKLALFLAGPESDYITGATIDINGGTLMG